MVSLSLPGSLPRGEGDPDRTTLSGNKVPKAAGWSVLQLSLSQSTRRPECSSRVLRTQRWSELHPGYAEGTRGLHLPSLSRRLADADLGKGREIHDLLGVFAPTTLTSSGLGHPLKGFSEQRSFLESEPERGFKEFVLLTRVGCSGRMSQCCFLIGNSAGDPQNPLPPAIV